MNPDSAQIGTHFMFRFSATKTHEENIEDQKHRKNYQFCSDLPQLTVV